VKRETWLLDRRDDPPVLRFAANDAGAAADFAVAIRPGVETFGVPYETWAKLRSGSVAIRVEDDGRRVVESLPPEGPPPGPWPVRKAKEDR